MIVLIVEIRNTKRGDFGGGEENNLFCFRHAEFEVHVSSKYQRLGDGWKYSLEIRWQLRWYRFWNFQGIV